jgi:3-oxoacyl-(acyl-carrier-protein) synthase
MLRGGYIHPSMNCEDVHERIAPFAASIPHERREAPGIRTIVKASFGFGDVNACVVFRKWTGA